MCALPRNDVIGHSAFDGGILRRFAPQNDKKSLSSRVQRGIPRSSASPVIARSAATRQSASPFLRVKPGVAVSRGRGGAAEGMSFRACEEANDPQLATTTSIKPLFPLAFSPKVWYKKLCYCVDREYGGIPPRQRGTSPAESDLRQGTVWFAREHRPIPGGVARYSERVRSIAPNTGGTAEVCLSSLFAGMKGIFY